MTCRIILSGPFCTGKTTIRNALAEKHGIPKLIDETTRPMRSYECEGSPYHFITSDEFQKRWIKGYYFESVIFRGHSYGVPKHAINASKWSLDILSSSWDTYKSIPGVIGIYLDPPSLEELRGRACSRGDSEAQIEQRIEALKEEKPDAFSYHIPPQDTFEQTLAKVEELISKVAGEAFRKQETEEMAKNEVMELCPSNLMV